MGQPCPTQRRGVPSGVADVVRVLPENAPAPTGSAHRNPLRASVWSGTSRMATVIEEFSPCGGPLVGAPIAHRSSGPGRGAKIYAWSAGGLDLPRTRRPVYRFQPRFLFILSDRHALWPRGFSAKVVPTWVGTG